MKGDNMSACFCCPQINNNLNLQVKMNTINSSHETLENMRVCFLYFIPLKKR